jgi:hypothetical protein
MTPPALPFILAGKPAKAELNPEHLDSTQAQTAARFWAGKYQGSNAKAACVERIAAVWSDPKRVEQILAALRPEERTVLGVVRRFGGSLSGALLQRELLARGALRAEDPDEPTRFGRNQLSADPVLALCERLVLIREPGYHSYWSYGPLRDYPDVFLPSQLVRFVNPASPLTWKVSKAVPAAPETTTMRSTAQMLVDFDQTARVLDEQGAWKTNQGGALPSAMRSRLAKLRPPVGADPFAPPDRATLDYSLLCALGAVVQEDGSARLDRDRMNRLLTLTPPVQASLWTQAWLGLRLWQDGIGAVPERDSDANPTRINPDKLKRAREMLAWALTRVAHNGTDDWLDLEAFLLDLHAAAGERAMDFYWHGFAWHPQFPSAVGKDKIAAGSNRTRAFWMDQEGIWAANALLSTLVHLGLLERGRNDSSGRERWSFRLTDVGKAVFAAPEVTFKMTTVSDKCLTVQPNHDVLLYLDAADGEAISMLGRIASQESATGFVQTFKLTRGSLYGALEGGATPAGIESFLSSRSRSGLPANVAQSLAEWSRKRESLVVRSEVAIEFLSGSQASHGRPLGSHLFLSMPRAAHKEAKNFGVRIETTDPRQDWKVDEHGIISLNGAMSAVGGARLRRFAELIDGTWRISRRSVHAARELGVTAEQMVGWLTAHTGVEVPPVLMMAIRNWASGRAKVFFDRVVLLQVNDSTSFAALNQSKRLHPHIKGVLAPGTFVVAEEGRKEAATLLRDLGFSLDADCKLSSPGNVPSVPGETAVAGQFLALLGGRRYARRSRP